MSGTRLVIRISEALEARIIAAGVRHGQDKSGWARDVLEAAALSDERESLAITTRDRVLGQVEPLGASRTSIPGLCIHPLSGRETRGIGEQWCRVCETRLR